MSNAFRTLWASRAPRERAVIAALAALLCIGGYAWLLHASAKARTQLNASIAQLRTQAVLLDQQANEHARLRAMPVAVGSQTDLRALIQSRAEAARVSGALTRLDVADADHVNLALGAVPFADWLGFVGALQAQQVRLELARIEAHATPGLVSVSASFARSRP